jgi:ankyrin repeat protein
VCGQGWVEEGQTPLHLAALVGTKEVVRALTEADAPLEALGGVDITLLQHAIRHVNVGAVERRSSRAGGRVRGATIEAAGESNHAHGGLTFAMCSRTTT